MERVAIIAHLKKGSEQRAADLVEAGPPFDLAHTGIVHHSVYVSAHEVVFVCSPCARAVGGDRRWTTAHRARAVRLAAQRRPTNRGSSDRKERVMGVIVVGIDHSKGAKAALRFALEEARLRKATLRVVHAWQFGYVGATGLEGWLPAAGGELDDFRKGAAAALDETLKEVAADTDGVMIERRAEQGAPAEVLIEESQGADLLVVGSRGHGGFAQLLLGSVSQQCAQHASCPVVIVRGTSANGK
jgi:nucleotide-binding universal stress UspA family protein